MWHVRHCWNRFAVGLLLALTWCLPGVAQAGRFPSDPVEEMRQALRQDRDAESAPALAVRKKNLERHAKVLKDVGDLSRALVLREWRYGDRNPLVAQTDKDVWDSLAKRFAKEIEQALRSGKPLLARSAADLISEMTTSIQASEMQRRRAQQEPLVALAPALIPLTREGDLPLRTAAIRALGRLTPIWDEATRKVTPNPKAIVDVLRGVLLNEAVPQRRAAAEALANLIRVASPTGTKLPIDIDPLDLAALRDASIVVVPAAGLALKDPDSEVRRLGVEAIQQAALNLEEMVAPRAVIVPPGEKATPSPENKKGEQRMEGGDTEQKATQDLLRALAEQGANLARVARDPDANIRVLALRTLEQIGYDRQRYLERYNTAKPARPPIDPKDKVMQPLQSAQTLLVRGEAPQAAPEDVLLQGLRMTLDAVIADLTDTDVRVRLAAIDALEMLGEDGLPAAPALIRALADPNVFVRWAAARTLGKMIPGGEDAKIPAALVAAVPVLAQLLCDPDLDLRLAVAEALGRFGPEARPAVAALAQAVRKGDVEIRVAAIDTLGEIGTETAPAIPAVIEALRSDDPRLQRAAARLLGRFGPAASEAVEPLRAALNDPDPEVRRIVSEALLSILR